VVEVADSSLAKDRKVKRGIYAEAGAPRYWIVEIPERMIRVLEDPHGGDYRTEKVVHADGALILPFIDVEVRAADLLPIG
jgi:Uma2 family endonuclease